MTIQIGDMVRFNNTGEYFVIVHEDIYPAGIVRLKMFSVDKARFDYWTCPFGRELPDGLFQSV